MPYALRSLIVGTCAVACSWELRPDDVNSESPESTSSQPTVPDAAISSVNMMPLFHVGGIVRNLWAPVFSGGSAIMCPGFDSTAFWPIIITI